MKTRRGRTVVTLTVLVFAGAFCVLALPLSPSARRLPLFAGVVTVAAATLQLVVDRRRSASDGPRDGAAGVAEGAVIGWTAALLAGIYLVGLLAALPIFAALSWRIRDRTSWISAVTVGLLMAAFIQGVLISLLGLELYGGQAAQWLLR